MIGGIAARDGLELHELHTVSASLEEAYMALTRTAVGYPSAAGSSLTTTEGSLS